MKFTVWKRCSIVIFTIWMVVLISKNTAFACDLCSLGGFGGTTGAVNPIAAESPKKNKYTLGYILEYQDLEAVSVTKAHELH